MPIDDIIKLIKEEHKAQLNLISLRQQICNYSLPLGSEIYGISKIQAADFVKKVNFDLAIGDSNLFNFNSKINFMNDDNQIKITDSEEVILLKLINIEP